jgi:hypothetical protein
MRNRLRGAVPASALLLLGLAVWPAAETLKGDGSEVTVHNDPATPKERAEFREALRYREETGKWPCPESGRPPRQPAQSGMSDLMHRAGPDDYDCPTQDDQR